MDEQDITIFLCGRSKCDHDWSKEEPIIEDGKVVGGTLVCAKCGRTAFQEDQWL